MVGRSRDAILKLCKKESISRPNKQAGHKALADMPRISPQHVALGLRITLYRGSRSATEVARELGVSRYVLRSMEFGVHDFTLTQLQKLSSIMGQTIEQLIEQRHD